MRKEKTRTAEDDQSQTNGGSDRKKIDEFGYPQDKKNLEKTRTDDMTFPYSDYLTEILKLTGREERFERKPILTDEQQTAYSSLISILIDNSNGEISKNAKCDLFDRILLVLGIKPISQSFFDTFLGDVNFSDISDFSKKVGTFRKLCALEYGNFRFCYKVLRNGEDVQNKRKVSDLMSYYFPDNDKKNALEDSYKSKAEVIGLITINANDSFTLGYVSSDYSMKVTSARQKLKNLLKKALEKDSVKDFKTLEDLAKANHIENLNNLVNEAAITSQPWLLFPGFHSQSKPYHTIISEVIEECRDIGGNEIKEIQKKGTINTTVYLGMHDVDVYMATSMRSPIHFTSNAQFIKSLFSDKLLRDLKLRYFDPTQSFRKDRIQKGLIESLMIARAKVTIYNAQESDSFGKDSEASVAISQGKDVIVYVARLFHDNPAFTEFYNDIDKSYDKERDRFLDYLEEKNYIDADDKEKFSEPGKTKADIIKEVAHSGSRRILKDIDFDHINSELAYLGYTVEGANLKEEVSKLIAKLEARAITFGDTHPLSFQIFSQNGVARGVLVTRTVEDTAKILRGLLIDGLSYTLYDDEFNYLLKEKISGCPIRIVVKDNVLTGAFWNEFSRDQEKRKKHTD